MGKVKITINSVRAVNKNNNVMSISYNIGKIEHTIQTDCTTKTIYKAVEDDLSNHSHKLGITCTREYESYDFSIPEGGAIIANLKKLDKDGHEPYNKAIYNYMRVITD